jgi:hypothetical protein
MIKRPPGAAAAVSVILLTTIVGIVVMAVVLLQNPRVRHVIRRAPAYLSKCFHVRLNPNKPLNKTCRALARVEAVHVGGGGMPQRKHIIAMSLWGKDDLYIDGARRTVQRCAQLLPAWKVRIYVPRETWQSINGAPAATKEGFEEAEIFVMDRDTSEGYEGAMWRFLALDGPPEFQGQRAVCLDADDGLHSYILEWIEKWMDEDSDSHAAVFSYMSFMRFLFPLQAGRIGAVVGALPVSIKMKMQVCYGGLVNYGDDEAFLYRYLWPVVVKMRKGDPRSVHACPLSMAKTMKPS